MNAPMTLSIATQQYLEFLETQGKSDRTLYTYNRDMKQILAFFGPDRLVENIPLPLIGRFLKSDELLKLPNGQERAPQTVRKTTRVFRLLLTWLHETGTISELNLPKSIQKRRSTESSEPKS